MLAEILCRCSGLPQQYVQQQYIHAPINAVIKGWRIEFPTQVKGKHTLLVKLAERCWHMDASKRLTFKDIRLHLDVIGKIPGMGATEDDPAKEHSVVCRSDDLLRIEPDSNQIRMSPSVDKVTEVEVEPATLTAIASSDLAENC